MRERGRGSINCLHVSSEGPQNDWITGLLVFVNDSAITTTHVHQKCV
jgi:hypothetical protein